MILINEITQTNPLSYTFDRSRIRTSWQYDVAKFVQKITNGHVEHIQENFLCSQVIARYYKKIIAPLRNDREALQLGQKSQ